MATLRDPDKIRIAYIVAGLALILGGSLGFGATRCDNQDRGPREFTADDAIASIDDREITFGEYIQTYQRYETQMRMQDQAVLPSPEYDANQRYAILNQLIYREYFYIRGQMAGFEVTEQEIDAAVESIRSTLMPEQEGPEDRSVLERIGDALSSAREDSYFEQALQQRIDPTMTISKLRELLEKDLMVEKYMTQRQGELDRQMMTELNAEADGVREEINGGLEFQDAAMQYSDHAESSQAGGLVPLVKRDTLTLPEEVVTRAFTLPPGEVSLTIPVTTQEYKGMWLLTVVDRKIAEELTSEEASEIENTLLEEKRIAIQSGEMEMPEDENIVVTPEEVAQYYDEATIRVIFMSADDVQRLFWDDVQEGLEDHTIVINDPELRAIRHATFQEWAYATADYMGLIVENQEAWDPESPDQYAYEMKEARLRYLIAMLWTDPIRNLTFTYNDNWDEMPENSKALLGGYFALCMMNFNRAVELQDIEPWYRLRRGQVDVFRRQVTPRVIEDMRYAHEYGNRDMNVEYTILDSLMQAIRLDDAALEEADGERPEEWVDPIYPEEELGLTLDQIDQPFIELIDLAAGNERSPEGLEEEAAMEAEREAMEEDSESDDVLSVVEEEIPVEAEVDETGEEIIDEMTGEASGEMDIDPGDEDDETVETDDDEPVEIPDYVPLVPIPEPTGPLTEELRTELEDLRDLVQAQIDVLNASMQAQQSGQQEIPPEVLEQLQAEMESEEGTEVSEEAENLLQEDVETDESGE